MSTDYGGWGSHTMGLLTMAQGIQKYYGTFGLGSSSDTVTYNQILTETQMCDISDTTNCVLGTTYFPLYAVYSVLPNVWDENFVAGQSKLMAGTIAAEVNAGKWANL